MTPVLARTKAGLHAVRAALADPVVLVPTMGALHHGHRALLRQARALAGPAGSVVVSIFVNPLQFGVGEDFDRYPRPLDTDLAACAEEGVAVVFAPSGPQMYPVAPMVTVSPGSLGRRLEGQSRPGFFDGVLTVVLKLFELVRPAVAVFGEKDAQQLALVRRMTAELNLDVAIAAVPIVRDPDGLAVSSRNGYLSAPERAAALALPRALQAGSAAAADGPDAVRAAARLVLDGAAAVDPPLRVDYLALADPVSFEEVGADFTGRALLLAAAWAGRTRLIDNLAVTVGARPAHSTARRGAVHFATHGESDAADH
jgi:pantoate--beta-alanine ligase